MNVFLLILITILSIFISTEFPDYISFGSISLEPNILIIYFVTIYWSASAGIIIAFIAGLYNAIFFQSYTGVYTLFYCSMAFLLYIAEDKIYKFSYISLLLLFITVLIMNTITEVIHGSSSIHAMRYFFTEGITSAILNSIAGFIILFFIRKFK